MDSNGKTTLISAWRASVLALQQHMMHTVHNRVQQRAGALPVRPARPSRVNLRVRSVAEAGISGKAPAGASSTGPLPDVLGKVKTVLGKSAVGDHAPKEAYTGVAYSVRDQLIDKFNKTHAHWEVRPMLQHQRALGTRCH